MGYAETFVMRRPDFYHQAARDALAHRPCTAGGSRRSLAVVPSIWIEGTRARLPGDCGGVTQRIVSWGRSRDGSEFAHGNRSVDTEGFCKSQMALNSGLRWLRATLCCFRWNGRNSVPNC